MPRGKPHTPQLRAAVLADLLTGNAVAWVAHKHHISKGLVSQWRREAGITPEVRTKRAISFGELVANYLQQALTTATVQAALFADTEWLKKQSAADLAELHGVLLDRSVRILAALERPAELSEPDAGAAGPIDATVARLAP